MSISAIVSGGGHDAAHPALTHQEVKAAFKNAKVSVSLTPDTGFSSHPANPEDKPKHWQIFARRIPFISPLNYVATLYNPSNYREGIQYYISQEGPSCDVPQRKIDSIEYVLQQLGATRTS